VRDFLLKSDAGFDDGLLDTNPRVNIYFHDRGDATLPQPTMRFGLMTQDRRKLTYDEYGRSNNTVVKVDGAQYRFGEGGTWIAQKVDLGLDGRRQRLGYKSIWAPPGSKIQVTQIAEIIGGEQTRVLDTCLVRYTITNQDSQSHNVGLRFMLDTFIGHNDGVPYTIPGDPKLCDTQMVMTGAQIPDFIQALEHDDLRNPGTIAHLKLKMGAGFTPPDRVTLGAWPNHRLRTPDNKAPKEAQPGADTPASERTMWEVPILPIKAVTYMPRVNERGDPDSCVVIYWDEKPLAAGQSREMGFTYGLGSVSSEGGRLGLTVDGDTSPGGTFTLVAQVKDPQPGENLTVTLPEGFRLADGSATVPVPAGTGRVTVTWKIKAGNRGRYTLRVQSTAGAAQSKQVIIASRDIFK
jgi:hypothetical protein